ncbi:type IV pilin [Methanolacinia petrolearia]|uniref:type IV pilin n=1 Tax=Methanolacinia petrolearia TaxID=54120 RepID=UPI003BAB2EC7
MKISKNDENGVSPIIGEMFMLSLVLILAALFAVSASQYIPEDREQSLNVMMEDYNATTMDVTLWHKGGDTVSNQSIKIILSNGTDTIPLYAKNFSINGENESNFMPGDFMVIDTKKDVSGYTVQMVVSKSVVFFGRVES